MLFYPFKIVVKRENDANKLEEKKGGEEENDKQKYWDLGHKLEEEKRKKNQIWTYTC